LSRVTRKHRRPSRFTTSVAAAAILVTAAAAGAAAWPSIAAARQPAGGRFAAISADMVAPSARPRQALPQPQLGGYQRLGRQLQQVKALDARAQEARAALRARQAAAARRARASRQAAERQAAQRSAAAASQAQQPTVAPPVSSGSPQRIAMSMLGSYGWSSSQFSCLDSLWNAESGWNPAASNPSSGAFGIPQALPGLKMASAGADWQTNPATQIRWGLGYIQSLYGSPCGAWAHEESAGWY